MTPEFLHAKKNELRCWSANESEFFIEYEHKARLENLGDWSPRLDFQLCLVSKIIGNGLQK